MKRKAEQIKNGRFEYAIPRLILSQEKIHVQLKSGETSQGELYFGAENESKIKGYVNTSNRRCIPSVEKFSGTAIQIAYGIDAGGMKPGEVCEGVLTLVTSIGEYTIPFIIEAEREEVKASIGMVNDLQSFVKLAESNYREAFRLFTNPSFVTLISAGDERLRALYKGMSQNPVTYQHLEEFLIGAGLKDAVHISAKEDQAQYYEVTETQQDTMTIVKSGWGYLRLEIETQGDFIQVQKRTVAEDEFIGSSYHLEYVILHQMLGRGKKHGSIIIRSPYETITYHITASRNPNLSVNMNTFEKKKKALLYRDYLSFRLHKLDFKSWSDRALVILKELGEAGCDYPVYQIYEAYLCHMNGDDDRAREILLRFQDKSFTRDDIELAGGYLYTCYLTGLLTDREKMVSKLQRLYQQGRDSFILLWILMQYDESMKGSASRTLHMMEDYYEIGGRSPLMYLEAYQLVEQNMDQFTRVDSFWTQVMLFAASEKLLTEEICMRIAYLSGYEKSFSQSLYKTLTMAYIQYPSNDTLEAICKMIMKENPGNKKYFPWFERAVEQNLRLTRLYECYIETIDERYQQILPKTIRMYFVYNNALSDRKKAFVYANVVRHKDEDYAVYESYQRIIYDFALKKLREGVINEDYAVLYQELSASMRTEEEKECLSKVVFANRLYCDDKKIRNVIIQQSQMKAEEIYPCVKGVAYPRIYTDDAVILFQDSQQRRYATTVDYNLRRLFDEETMERCKSMQEMDDGFLLYICNDRVSGGSVTAENMDCYSKIAASDRFTHDYRREVRKKLLEYYRDNARGEEIDEYLRSLDYMEFASVDKKQLMELLIERGMLQEAYEVLCEFGYEDVEVQALLILCSRMILKYEFEADDELLCLAYDVFAQGIYDEVILHYLMLYYIGSADAMFRLWEAAKGFQMDTYRLEEKLLTQFIFVEEYSERGSIILESYVKQKGREEIILSWLTFQAYGYFVRHKPMAVFVQQCLESAYDRAWEMNIICKTALLKLHTEKKEWSAQQEKQVKCLLEECYDQHLQFEFFRKLPRELLASYQLDDKVFVEYQGNPAAKVILYYALDTGLGNEPEYKSEPLRNVFQGCFNKTFTLFYGESLHYYFVTELDGKEERTSEKTVTAIVTDHESQTRFEMINEMLAARKLGKLDVVKEKIRQYQQQEMFVEQLFSIEKEHKA